MRQLMMLVLLAMMAYGCEKTYEFDEEVEPQIILNSFLSPDSMVKVDLWWSKRMDGNRSFKRVVGAQVKLSEDGVPILNATSGNGQLVWNYQPKAGSTYTITIEQATQPLVTAQTTVPHKPTGSCAFEKTVTKEMTFDYYRIDNATVDPATTSALLISLWKGIDPADLPQVPGVEAWEWDNISEKITDEHTVVAQGMYSNIFYADQFNVISSKDYAHIAGTDRTMNYARIHSGNVSKAFPVTLSTMNQGSNRRMLRPRDWWFYPEIYPDEDSVMVSVPEKLYVGLMAADENYDMYRKSYEVYIRNVSESEFSLIQNVLFSAPSYRLHCNVINGLGIFASFNSIAFGFYPSNFDFYPDNL